MMFSIYFPHPAQAEFPGVQGYAANKTCILHVPVKLTQTHKNHFLISLATYFYLHVCTSHYFQLCTNSICSRCNKSGLLACVRRHRSWCLWERLQVSPTEASGVWLCRKWMRVAALREQSMESRCNAVLQTSWASHMIVYSPSCHSRPVWLHFFCRTQKNNVWRTLTFNSLFFFTFLGISSFFVPHKKESHSGLVWDFHFWLNNP